MTTDNRIITNKKEMLLKFKTIFGLLAGQVTILDGDVRKALKRFNTVGNNERAMLEAFFAMIEAIEKVVEVQGILSDGKKPTELAAYIQHLKGAFKARDLAMSQSKAATIHKRGTNGQADTGKRSRRNSAVLSTRIRSNHKPPTLVEKIRQLLEDGTTSPALETNR